MGFAMKVRGILENISRAYNYKYSLTIINQNNLVVELISQNFC